MNKTIFTIALTLAATSQAFAADTDTGISYNNASIDYRGINVDGKDNNHSGIKIGGQYLLTENFFAGASYAHSEADLDIGDSTFTELHTFAGYRLGIAEKWDFNASLTYADNKVDIDVKNGGNVEDNNSFWSIRSGMSGLVLEDKLQLDGGLLHWINNNSADESKTGVYLGAKYFITEQVSANVELETLEGREFYTLGASYHF